FKGVRVDNLPRAMWYNPQHSFSFALGLVAVPIAIWGGVLSPLSAIALAGGALGASIMFNPLLGASLCAVYGFTMLVVFLSGRARMPDLLRHGLAVVPVVLALGWCALNQVGDGAGAALVFG